MNSNELTTLINKHADSLHTHALRFTRDTEDADDLVQDTLIKALRFLHTYEKGSNLKGWLFVIMRNTFINAYRSRAKKMEVITTEDQISDVNLAHSASRNKGENKMLMEDIQKALDKVPESYRVPFIRYFEGYKYNEIAEELNIPLGTVKTHIHQARLMLKKQLKNYAGDTYLRNRSN